MTAVLDCDPQTNCVRSSRGRVTQEPMVFAMAHENLLDASAAART